MKLTREQSMQLTYKAQKPVHIQKLKKRGEVALYNTLRKEHQNGIIFGMKIKDYVEKLKKEIEQEQKAQ